MVMIMFTLLKHLIDQTQEMLCEAYQYVGVKWDDSCRDFEGYRDW